MSGSNDHRAALFAFNMVWLDGNLIVLLLIECMGLVRQHVCVCMRDPCIADKFYTNFIIMFLSGKF